MSANEGGKGGGSEESSADPPRPRIVTRPTTSIRAKFGSQGGLGEELRRQLEEAERARRDYEKRMRKEE